MLKAFIFGCLFCISLQSSGQVVLNKFDKNKVSFYVGLEKPTEHFDFLQIAQKFESPSDNPFINEVVIRRMILDGDDYIVNTELLTKTRFLLRVYDVDPKTGAPGKDLCAKTIEVKNLTDEMIKVDLRKHRISIPGKYFFVGVEWLRIDYNEQATLVGDDDLLFSVTAVSKSRMKIYQPFVGMSNVKGSKSNGWVLTHDNKWRVYNYFAPDLTDFAISAVVSYSATAE